MDESKYEKYIAIMKEEMIPALGCTEPIAIAYAAATARDLLGVFPSGIKICAAETSLKMSKV